MSGRPFFADRAGAVLSDDGIAHFGDPMREQRRLASGHAIAPRDDRAVIEVAGPDRLTWLDSITSQAVAGLAPGHSTELLVLDPQGRVEHAAGVLDDGASTWLIADAGDAAGLARWLTMMRFRAQVEVRVRDDLAVLGFMELGDAEKRVALVAHRPHELPLVWGDPWREVAAGGWQYAAPASHPAAGYGWIEAIVERTALPQLADAELAGLLAAEALRIEAWRPRWSREVDERAIPHEFDWLRSAVHLNKGCYRGQETVAKVHNLGHPPRRLTLLHLDGSDSVLPEPGTAVLMAGGEGEPSEVGHVTSSALHHELGPVALAVLARRVPGDAVLEIRSDGARIAAAQEVIVPADAGATAAVPRLTRLSRRPLAQDPAKPAPAE
ncbi:folate-binding protein [Microbacterium sp. MEC084]|uniref:CAF17-like 4Fe-4S cluster assembly/insertion protein YgfZ n=1 Tax=Microbacterium sp. MEC084 TaxID=1963027 RepID=UPI00106F63F3|nr:folate-binding protein YgfZ [Microbacterium sp. MEC084]MCD1268827.1 folate-binding protein [Microbacterium sp. MEC084]